MASEGKTKLSKNLMCMNCMQKGLDSKTKKELNEEGNLISEEHWYRECPSLLSNFLREKQSFLLWDTLLYGRTSFRESNPEFEKSILQLTPKNKAAENEENQTGGSCVRGRNSKKMRDLGGNNWKKFAKKRNRANYEEMKWHCNKEDILKAQR